jgi:hypothetical protein
MPRIKKVKRAGQGPDSARSMEPPKVFVMDRDIESQLPEDDDDIPPPPPLYRQVRKKTAPEPVPLSPPPPEIDDIDLPSNEYVQVPLQKKTSVRAVPNDLENALKSNPEFELGEDYGIYDEQFDGGKTRKHSKVRKYGRKTKTKRRGKKSRKSKTRLR